VRARQTGADIEKAIQTTGVIELGFLERGLTVLATISNVAPLLGFLGTVAGMISAFGAIAAAGQVEASLVAGGIKIALITTATGLIDRHPGQRCVQLLRHPDRQADHGDGGGHGQRAEPDLGHGDRRRAPWHSRRPAGYQDMARVRQRAPSRGRARRTAVPLPTTTISRSADNRNEQGETRSWH
jgi:hypothetical protein